MNWYSLVEDAQLHNSKVRPFSIQSTGSRQEVQETRQENSTLREQLSISLNQNTELSAECERLRTELTNISSLLIRQENRIRLFEEAYRKVTHLSRSESSRK